MGDASAVEDAEVLLEAMDGVRRTVARLPAMVADHAGLHPSRMVALGCIADGGSMVSDVAAATLLSVSAASRTVDVLVDDGLVDRARDPGNRRAVALSLTPSGEELVTELRRHFVVDLLAPIAAELGTQRTHEVAAALHDLVAAVSTHLATRPD